MLRLLILFVLLSGPAHAGAWPRKAGAVFVTTSSRVLSAHINGPFVSYSTLFLEYGLTEKLTLGLDLGRGVSGNNKMIGFIRMPLYVSKSGGHWAVEIGAGEIAGEATIRPGLSFGQGFSANKRSGWITLDTVAEYRLKSKRTDLKADLTFGLNYSDRVKGILQLQSGISSGDPSFMRLAPSIVIRAGKRTHVEIGTTFGLVGDNTVGIAFGLWREF